MAGSLGTGVILLHIVLLSVALLIQAAPQSSRPYPHVIPLEISTLLLYEIVVKDVTKPRSPENIESVLNNELGRHHVVLDRVDVPPLLKTLGNKIFFVTKFPLYID